MASETLQSSISTSENKQLQPMVSPPTAQSSQEKILQPEFMALTHCLKDAVVRTGQIYNFYADTRKLGIERHVPNPPRSLTAALGRDIEKYDQLCDSIEAHLLRAINVLKRDLSREEERIAVEERRKNAEALMLPPPVPPPTSEVAMEISSSQAPSEGSSTNPRNSPVLHQIPGRRPSAISISSLHRPQFPLKLDLSATSLRITEEEANAIFSKGLPSPVTLAPKSARPTGSNEFPPDFMAAFANSSLPPSGPSDIDLTLPDDMHLQQKDGDLSELGIGLGDSSDKPIELDLDSMDIDMVNMTNAFGNPSQSGESHTQYDLFSPELIDGEGEQLQSNDGNQPMKEEGDVLSGFNLDSTTTDELFGDFTPTGDLGIDLGASDASQSQITSAPSPESLLAQLSADSDLMKPPDIPPTPDPTEGFDINSIDISNLTSGFFANAQDSETGFSMDMEAFLNSGSVLNMDSSAEGKEVAGAN